MWVLQGDDIFLFALNLFEPNFVQSVGETWLLLIVASLNPDAETSGEILEATAEVAAHACKHAIWDA
jgi:hypothetical protein